MAHCALKSPTRVSVRFFPPTMTPKIESTTAAAAAEKVAGNTDLLEEILVHLPPKSVTRFNLVSKQWLSLITDAQFVHRHSQHSRIHRKFHTGMFVTDSKRICRSADFVSFTDELNPTHQTIPSLGFLYDRIESPVTSQIEIINSCNGLVLCSVSWIFLPFDYCVCNPTTKTFRMLGLNRELVRCSPKPFAFLAFDPSASLHYKVICRITTIFLDYDEKLYLYSSEDQSWKTIACPYEYSPSSGERFFLNGSIYYQLYGGWTSLCFDVYNEVVKQIDLPSGTRPFWTFLDVFGSHLYMLYHENTTPDFRVCEMSTDFSEWVTKYNASVGPLLSAFPQISYLLHGQVSYCFKVITVVEGAEDESQLVLGIHDKLLLYNLKEKTAKELYNLYGELDGLFGYRDVRAFQFIETLSAV